MFFLHSRVCCRSNGTIVDAHGAKIKCYPEVPGILESLQNEGYQMAVASRTGEIEGAYALVELFGWNKYFQYKEIYPGCKVTHFNKYVYCKRFEININVLFLDLKNCQDLNSKICCFLMMNREILTI